MRVRPAEPGDFDAVAELLAELGRPRVTDATRAACLATYRAQLDDPAAAHLVADDPPGEPVGFCSLHLRTRLNEIGPDAWVADLIVTERARRRGVARALLAEAERRAAERGCRVLLLESAHHREAAHRLYEAFGMRHVARAYGKRIAG